MRPASSLPPQIVCLMGIMYDAIRNGSSYTNGRDAVTAVLMITVLVTLVYFAVVVVTEVAIMWGEASARARLAAGKAGATSAGRRPSSRNLASGKDGGGAAGGAMADDAAAGARIGRVEATMNPMFMTKVRGREGVREGV